MFCWFINCDILGFNQINDGGTVTEKNLTQHLFHWTVTMIWNDSSPFGAKSLQQTKLYVLLARKYCCFSSYSDKSIFYRSRLVPHCYLFPASWENTAMPSKNNTDTLRYFHVNLILSLIALLITQSAHREYSSVNDINDIYSSIVMLLIWSTDLSQIGRMIYVC